LESKSGFLQQGAEAESQTTNIHQSQLSVFVS
jgi:hypothetical protein